MLVVERLREDTIREVAKQTGISRAEVAIQTEHMRPPIKEVEIQTEDMRSPRRARNTDRKKT
jgi:hypothetical protein